MARRPIHLPERSTPPRCDAGQNMESAMLSGLVLIGEEDKEITLIATLISHLIQGIEAAEYSDT